MGSAAVVTLLGCQREQLSSAAASAEPSAQTAVETATTETITADLPACVVSPQQTEGPYFVEEALNRSDIRADPSDGSVKAGVPLRLKLRVSQVSGGACIPLEGAVVDLWHCDGEGVYSDVTDRGFSTVGQKFLRGSQMTGADGTVEFITIYPGWYRGRAVHAHFKIRNSTDPQGYEFTSQLYFDDALSDLVHAQAPYSSQGQRDMRNGREIAFIKVEFGTSFGISTIFLAAAVRDNGAGNVITTEFIDEKAATAKRATAISFRRW